MMRAISPFYDFSCFRTCKSLNAAVNKCINCCFFYIYLCQSVIRKVNEIGLKTEHETNDEVRSYVRCLPALAFVPPDDVEEAFELLSESQPTTVDHLDELTTFFEHTLVAADDEDVQRLMVQPHSPSKPGISTLQGPAA